MSPGAKVEGFIDGARVETDYFDTAWEAQDWAKANCDGKWRLIDGLNGEPGRWHEEE